MVSWAKQLAMQFVLLFVVALTGGSGSSRSFTPLSATGTAMATPGPTLLPEAMASPEESC